MERQKQILELEKELLKAYNTLSGCMNFEQLRSFGVYFRFLKEFTLKEAKFGDSFVDRKYLQNQMQKHYDIFSTWMTPAIEDFELRKQCSKAFFEYRRAFKALTLLQAPKAAKNRKLVIDFLSFERELQSV